MASSWGEYLSGQSLEGFLNFLAFHAPFVEACLNNSPQRSIEVGCGGANVSIFLSLMGVEATGLDLEADVLEEARRHSESLRGKVQFVHGNGLATGFPDQQFDVAFSQGVIEHFPDEMIEKFLAESLRISRRVVASVPNNHYPKQDFGDERLLPAPFWHQRAEAAAKRAGIKANVAVSDYRRRFDRNNLLNSVRNIVQDRKIFTLIEMTRQ